MNIFLECFILVFAVHIDAFMGSFAYGACKAHIPFSIIIFMSILNTVALGLALFAGMLLIPVFSQETVILTGCIILLILGMLKLLGSLYKLFYKKADGCNAAENTVMTLFTSVPLALAVALDVFIMGLSAAALELNVYYLLGNSIFICAGLLWAGNFTGKKIARKININLAWLGGIILIIIACLRGF